MVKITYLCDACGREISPDSDDVMQYGRKIFCGECAERMVSIAMTEFCQTPVQQFPEQSR